MQYIYPELIDFELEKIQSLSREKAWGLRFKINFQAEFMWSKYGDDKLSWEFTARNNLRIGSWSYIEIHDDFLALLGRQTDDKDQGLQSFRETERYFGSPSVRDIWHDKILAAFNELAETRGIQLLSSTPCLVQLEMWD